MIGMAYSDISQKTKISTDCKLKCILYEDIMLTI